MATGRAALARGRVEGSFGSSRRPKAVTPWAQPGHAVPFKATGTVSGQWRPDGRRGVIEVRPAHDFEDMATMFAPKKPESSVCWCLSWRLPSKENRALVGTARAEK